MFELFYHLMEHIDGERGMQFVPYRWATMMKLWLLEKLDHAESLHKRYTCKLDLARLDNHCSFDRLKEE